MTRTDADLSAEPMRRSSLRRLAERALRPVDIAWLVAFRVLLGAVLCVSMIRFLAYGWVERFFVSPQFHFKYWGFEWVQPLSAQGMQAVFMALVVVAFTTAIGLAFRFSVLCLAIGISYFQLIDVSTYLNHYYLAALLVWLLAFSPAHRAYSVDAWLRQRWSKGKTRPAAQVAAAWLYLFRFQVGVVYIFAGLAKAQSDWLLHAQPLRIWLGASTELFLLGPLLTLPGVPLVMSWSGFLFDSSIVFWLSWRRTRVVAFAMVIVFHALTRVLFPIGMFPFIMVVSAMVFFDPSWPRTVVARCADFLGRFTSRPHLHRTTPACERSAAVATGQRSTLARSVSPLQAVGLGLAVCYCTIQLALPLRSLVYGGNVLWHEQGMRFSWRVMVRAKGGSTTFLVTNPNTGRTWRVKPDVYLTPMQESEMAAQPDLILQLARHIQRDFDSRGVGPVQVRAEARASLNGRRSAPFIDPTVDLTTQRDGLGLATFVLPAPNIAPPHTRPVP